jgi:hypothetical protein
MRAKAYASTIHGGRRSSLAGLDKSKGKCAYLYTAAHAPSLVNLERIFRQ